MQPRAYAAFIVLLFTPLAHASDFAAEVVNYLPAPGQFINNPAFNDPARALGPPVGGGTFAPDNTKLVSLGGFGGSISLRFIPPVEDGPCNPMGLDAIVFGNAVFVGGNPNRRFAEAAVVEISADVNTNGLADDLWYVILGSHLPIPPAGALQSQAWDNNPGTPTPPANIAWYPAPMFYPGFPAMYSTVGFRLPSLFEVQVLVNPLGLSAIREGIWGVADYTPTLLLGDTNADNLIDAPAFTPGEFYTVPENPFAVGISPGSGGGDAFDIAWAVDPATGAPAGLARFDFIRITTGANFIAGVLGEISTEVGGAADVRPRPSAFDLDGSGAPDAEDLYYWESLAASAASPADLSGNAVIDDADRALMRRCVRGAEVNDVSP